MKFKLYVHQRTFSEEEVVVNPRDFPSLNVGDVLEIYHPDDVSCHLLLQVKSLDVDFQQKDTISIDQIIATAFQLRPYSDVIVNKVSEEHGVLDMTELVLKDQYLNSSDMWRLKCSLVGSCVYLSKKIHFSGMRVQVSEMWAMGEKVVCGKITKDTKVLFRSQSAHIHLFLQMSAEMWEFDFFGDLYFERATNGFLSELFAKWIEKNCTHEVTIILFSRTHYQAKSLDEFPTEMQKNIVRNTDGLFYQDFFKTVTFSEKCDDWTSVIVELKKNVNNYLSRVGCAKETMPTNCPRGWNSKAFEGNVLEAINISLNIFEKHFVDCSLELTNWSMILVTPGQGVFNVNKELTGLTKQRVMDSGVGIDLVCLAEQPLHAVPLFRCIKKDQAEKNTQIGEDYCIPPWINYSFYSSIEQTQTCPTFVPRMKIPEKSVLADANPPLTVIRHTKTAKCHENLDFDKYDAQVFLSGAIKSYDHRHKVSSRRKGEGDHVVSCRFSPEYYGKHMGNTNQDLHHSYHKHSTSSLFQPNNADNSDTSSMKGSLSAPEIQRPSSDEATYLSKFPYENGNLPGTQSPPDPDSVNPFKPFSFSYKVSLFRHRWQHAFPTGPHGEALQEHHRFISESESHSKSPAYDIDLAAAAICRSNVLSGASGSTEMEDVDGASEGDTLSIKTTSEAGYDDVGHRLTRRGAQDWKLMTRLDDWNDPLFRCSPDENTAGSIMTTVDWKSLTVPACLPLTTEYFPDKRTLEKDYVEYNYNLIIDDPLPQEQRATEDSLFGRSKMTAKQKFDEIISQRLAQGFQVVINKERLKSVLTFSERSRHILKFTPETNLLEEHVLSLGNNIHHVQLCGGEVIVSKYAARHIPFNKPIDYKFNLWPHTVQGYTPVTTRFCYDGLEKYNWNYLDQYLTSAEGDFNQLSNDLRYWRTRFVLLPIRKPTSDQNCSSDEEMVLIEGFLRLLEALNRIKRPTIHRRLFSTRKLLRDGRDSLDGKAKRKFSGQPHSEQSRGSKRNEQAEKGTKDKIVEDQTVHQKSGQKVEEVAKVGGRTGNTESAEKSIKPKTEQTIPEFTSQVTQKKDEEDERGLANKDQVKVETSQDSKGIPKENGKQNTENKQKDASKRDLIKTDSESRAKRQTLKESPVANEPIKKDKEKKVSLGTDEQQETPKNGDTEVKKNTAETATSPSKMPPEHALSINSDLAEVIRVMQNPEYGLSFLPEQPLIRPWTFISAETVAWMIKSVDGIDTKADAVKIAQRLLDSALIVHASGTSKEEFKDGFVLYYIDQSESSKTKGKRGEEELIRNYNTRWVEVNVWRENIGEDIATFLQPNASMQQMDQDTRNKQHCNSWDMYKSIDLKVDPMRKSDRPEWCLAWYQANYFPKRAFSLELHWMVATGCIVSELVQGWARKATSGGLHLIPAPITPFSTQLNGGKRNPLLKPIFIPLAIECLTKDDSRHVFHDFDKTTWERRILLLLEAILFRFGFLLDSPKSSVDNRWHFENRISAKVHLYIHWSGGLLAKIEEKRADSAIISPTTSRPSSATSGKTEKELMSYRQSSNRVKLAVNRLLMDLDDTAEDKKNGVGIYCLNNYALTKKWRSNITGDQEAATRLLSDLQNFCSNKDSALVDFWNEKYAMFLQQAKPSSEIESLSHS